MVIQFRVSMCQTCRHHLVSTCLSLAHTDILVDGPPSLGQHPGGITLQVNPLAARSEHLPTALFRSLLALLIGQRPAALLLMH